MAAVVIDRSRVNAFLHSPNGPVNAHLRDIALRTRSAAQRRMPRRSGRLADTLIVEQGFIGDRPMWSVKTDPALGYGLAVHEGSRPHVIRARRAGSLHFFWENQGGLETFVPKKGGFQTFVDARGILHIGKGGVLIPAQPGTFFLTKALQEVVQGSVV